MSQDHSWSGPVAVRGSRACTVAGRARPRCCISPSSRNTRYIVASDAMKIPRSARSGTMYFGDMSRYRTDRATLRISCLSCGDSALPGRRRGPLRRSSPTC